MKNENSEGNILIVDDTPENLTVLRQMLTDYYNVRPAINGEVALKAADTDPPDLIILDILMPDMNGFEVAQRLKAQASTRDIPIIFVSALDDAESISKAFDYGGVDYLTKPFQLDEVMIRVSTHLQLYKLQKSLEERNTVLEKALDDVRQLRGTLPMCDCCKDVYDEEGKWEKIEKYISEHSGATFTHGICPECASSLSADLGCGKHHHH